MIISSLWAQESGLTPAYYHRHPGNNDLKYINIAGINIIYGGNRAGRSMTMAYTCTLRA